MPLPPDDAPPSLSLPVQPDLDSSLPSPPTTPFPKRRPLHVLLVDDNPVNLQVLARALQTYFPNLFQHMDLQDSGAGALKALQHHQFDLILLDIDMPGLNGIDTARSIRESAEYQHQSTPIVAVTTNDSDECKATYTRVGMNGCIGKPIAPELLKQTLLDVLDIGSQ